MRLTNNLFLLIGLVLLFVNLLFLFFFFKLFRLWLQSFLSGARISVPQMLSMYLRRSPVAEIVRLRIMAVQSGLAIPTEKIEAAALAEVDVERAVLAMLRARELQLDITWEEVIRTDFSDRLKDKLFPE